MKGARAAGGQGAATSISPAQFFKPVEDRGVVVLLELPEEAAEERKKRGAKRRRPEEAAARTVTHEASAYQLKSASPKFRAALERWSTESGGKRELRFQCASEQVTESRGHLLECIHSMGQQLPADLGAIVSLLLLAREHAVEPAVAAGNVDYKEDAPVRNPDRAGLTAAQFKAKCRSWGHPRKPRLPLKPAAAEFEVQMTWPASEDEAFSSPHYWGGCFWRINLFEREQGGLGIFLMPALNLGFSQSANDKAKPQLLSFALRVEFGISMSGTGCSWHAGGRARSYFYPETGDGRGQAKVEYDGKAVTWADFWADNSPWLVNGTARVRFNLAAPA